jgi:putative ABC transport system permease protein
VISFSVKRRVQEIGIRMALGAQAPMVLQMVLRQSLGLILSGVGLGLVGALILTRFISSQLFGVAATDPLSYAGVTILLISVALLACYVPARRASRVNPMLVLRYE